MRSKCAVVPRDSICTGLSVWYMRTQGQTSTAFRLASRSIIRVAVAGIWTFNCWVLGLARVLLNRGQPDVGFEAGKAEIDRAIVARDGETPVNQMRSRREDLARFFGLGIDKVHLILL